MIAQGQFCDISKLIFFILGMTIRYAHAIPKRIEDHEQLQCIIFGQVLSPLCLLSSIKNLLRGSQNFLVLIFILMLNVPMYLPPIPPQIPDRCISVRQTTHNRNEIFEESETGVGIDEVTWLGMMKGEWIFEFRFQCVDAFPLERRKVFGRESGVVD